MKVDTIYKKIVDKTKKKLHFSEEIGNNIYY